MFKKLKDKIEEEFKQAPLKFPVSVQQLAQVISPSQSVNSLSDNNASSSLTYPADMSNVSTDFFSIGDDDDPQDGVTKMPLTLHNVDLTATSPSNMTHNMSRSRRSSLSSVTSEPSSLFPIYEGALNQNFLQSDLESEMEDGMSGQIEKISKEQLYQSFKKILNRYNKYKNRYSELIKHYKELQHDNFKTKNVLQESQDKALRRIAELREQCQLEQKAKAHLEESLRNDVEERDHIINTLKTKISLLSNEAEIGQLIDLEGTNLESSPKSKELWHLKSQNEDLQREIERLKKIKESACNFIHRCDTTINEATEDVKSDNIKQKMSELKSEIEKMKSENESLSNLLSRNIMTDEDRKSQASIEYSLITDFCSLESSQGDQKTDEKDKKIDKLSNLLLKCKEKINELNTEIKAKDLIIEDNNKKISELREEVDAYKMREEENAISVAENKKAIHEELNAKEEQIKALKKELKTKENEFIKEKAEVINSYEDKIRDMTTDFTKEMKLKNEQNQNLREDLKAKEIVSGSLDKVKSIEESFGNMLEFVRTRSLNFEEFAKLKTAEIEKAQERLEERVTTARKNLTELLQNAKKIKSVKQMEEVSQQKVFDLHSDIKNLGAEASENFHIVEKLKSDVINLSKKLEIVELELVDSKNESKSEREEKDKCKENQAVIEAEIEKLKKEFQEKLNENTELAKALKDRNEKIKKVESEKKLLQKATSEKIETESKLREYIENYNKLEKENRTLQNDLVEKCGKLLKELNESKEKIKNLENQEKAKVNELETVRNQYSKELKIKLEENECLKNDVETLRKELNESKKDLEKMKNEEDRMITVTQENEASKAEMEKLLEKIKEQETNLEKRDEKTKELEKELANIRKEMSQEKRSSETIRNELDALRNNLKSELKEKDEKSILVDKLTLECNLLLAEIENLKKSHGKAEKKLESDFETARKEISEKKNLIEKLQMELEQNKKENQDKSTSYDELAMTCDTLKEELDALKQQQTTEKAVKAELKAANEELKNKFDENEKLLRELKDQISKLTNEKNEALGELQVKLSETETLKNGLQSLKDELKEKTKAFEKEKVRLMSENENKLNILKNEIKFINTKHEEDIGNFEENLSSEMKEVSEKMEIAEKASVELLEKLEKITNERDELKVGEEEKNLKISELENCILALKVELDDKFNCAITDEDVTEKHNEEIKQIIIRYDKEIAERDEEIESLKLKLSNEEEINNEHREEVKQIILQYDRTVAERDEEVESLKSKLSDYNYIREQLKITKGELMILRKELVEKDGAMEVRSEAAVKLKKDVKNTNQEEDANDLKEILKQMEKKLEEQKIETEKMRSENEKFLEEKMKWEEKMAELHKKYEKDTRKWNSQLKNVSAEKNGELVEPECLKEVELESTSKVFTASIESSSNSIDLLQKQVIQQAAEMKELKKQHKKEIIELKKMSASKRRGKGNSSENQDWLSSEGGGGGLENDTEHEYLRNILYEYMMGKEQLVLAKVLSAIVKFNEEQTHNVLEKEQQRQTLFGQLGLL